VGRVVAPALIGGDLFNRKPCRGSAQAVGAIEDPAKREYSGGSAAVAFPLIGDDARAAERAAPPTVAAFQPSRRRYNKLHITL
jgi:hypothetical protein